jgi:hypothetical protein
MIAADKRDGAGLRDEEAEILLGRAGPGVGERSESEVRMAADVDDVVVAGSLDDDVAVAAGFGGLGHRVLLVRVA